MHWGSKQKITRRSLGHFSFNMNKKRELDTLVEYNPTKINRSTEDNVVFARVIAALSAMDLISFSQTCKLIRKIVQENILAWCFDIESHPDPSISRNAILGSRMFLYQLYELYRRCVIGPGTYNAAKKKYFPDESLFDSASWIFVVPENCTEKRLERHLTYEPRGGVEADTVYGMTFVFPHATMHRPGVFVVDWNGKFEGIETHFTERTAKLFKETIRNVSDRLAVQIYEKGTGWSEVRFLEDQEYGLSVNALGMMVDRMEKGLNELGFMFEPYRANYDKYKKSIKNGIISESFAFYLLENMIDSRFGSPRIQGLFSDLEPERYPRVWQRIKIASRYDDFDTKTLDSISKDTELPEKITHEVNSLATVVDRNSACVYLFYAKSGHRIIFIEPVLFGPDKLRYTGSIEISFSVYSEKYSIDVYLVPGVKRQILANTFEEALGKFKLILSVNTKQV